MDLLGRCRAGSDQGRIDPVVLRPLAAELGVGSHLRGLEQNDHKSIAAQSRNRCPLVATARLDPHPLGSSLAQPSRQRPVAISIVGHLKLLSTSIDRHIELVLCRVDAGADHAMLAHLPRPFLVMRTLGSFNHPGPSEEPIVILLRTQPKRLWWATIRRSAVRPGWLPGPDRSCPERPQHNASR